MYVQPHHNRSSRGSVSSHPDWQRQIDKLVVLWSVPSVPQPASHPWKPWPVSPEAQWSRPVRWPESRCPIRRAISTYANESRSFSFRVAEWVRINSIDSSVDWLFAFCSQAIPYPPHQTSDHTSRYPKHPMFQHQKADNPGPGEKKSKDAAHGNPEIDLPVRSPLEFIRSGVVKSCVQGRLFRKWEPHTAGSGSIRAEEPLHNGCKSDRN